MHDGVIPHPPSEPLILIRQWQVEACEGNLCAAALLSFFEYWHNLKLANQKQAKEINDTAEKHGRSRDQLESLYQWHSTEALQQGILGLYGETLIQKSTKQLEKLGFISIHKNPNSDYKWDKTNFYLFHPEPVISWLREHKGIEVHSTHETPVNTDAVEIRHGCREKEGIDGHKNTAAITEYSLESKENTTTTGNFENMTPSAQISHHEREVFLTAITDTMHAIPPEAKRSAKLFHYTATALLRELGWTVNTEYPVTLADGSKGRVDIFVTAPVSMAIELDRVSPRDKSIEKLRLLDAMRIVVLRESPVWPDVIKGIDAVLCCGATSRPVPSHLVPDDFPRAPTPSMTEYADTNAPNVDLVKYHQWFLNYEFRKPGTAWDRRWNICLIKAENDGLHPKKSSQPRKAKLVL